MKRELAAVYDELKRRQREGDRAVFLRDDVLDFLHAASRRGHSESEDSGRKELIPPQDTEAPAVPLAPPPASASRKRPKAAPAGRGPDIPPPPEVSTGKGDREERLAALRKVVLEDSWCVSQVKPGKQVVFGVGSPSARIFFCGEAPGAEEEVQGEPFVGPAGQLLTKIIQAMGLSRGDVYIANIMNYRPPLPGPVGNRPPTEKEMAYCLPYLLGQLDIVQPEAVVALGKTAIDGLLGPDRSRRMAGIRGRWLEFNGIPLMPTYHPSYLLRNQNLKVKRQVWEDMMAVMDRLNMPVSAKQRGYFLSSP